MKKEEQQPVDGKQEIADWENVAKRALADLDNYKKQQDKMKGEMTQFMNIVLLHKFLSVSDDLTRMLDSVKSKKLDPKTIPQEVMQCQMDVMKGVEMTLTKINTIFEGEGLKKVDVKPGDKFDPSAMEAISYEEHAETKEDHVIKQFEAGLKYKDKIIKPVKVRVSKGEKNE